MAQIPQLKGAAGIGVDFGSDGPQPEAITGPGQARIQSGQHPFQVVEAIGLFGHQGGQLDQDSLLLLALLSLQLPQAIARRHHRLGFDVHRQA